MRNVVLLAHPDTQRLDGLSHQLDAAGFSVLFAASGDEALATAASYAPQLAVLHVDLPDIQGTDVCLRLKHEPATQKTAVVLIGKDTKEERFVGEEVGADAYLVDGDTDEVVVSKVRELFRTLILNAR